jgi:hypothetical protein
MRKISGYTVNIQGGGWKDWWDIQDKIRRARIRANANEYSPRDGDGVNVQDEIVETENYIKNMKEDIIQTQKEKEEFSEAIKEIERELKRFGIDTTRMDIERFQKFKVQLKELKKEHENLKELREQVYLTKKDLENKLRFLKKLKEGTINDTPIEAAAAEIVEAVPEGEVELTAIPILEPDEDYNIPEMKNRFIQNLKDYIDNTGGGGGGITRQDLQRIYQNIIRKISSPHVMDSFRSEIEFILFEKNRPDLNAILFEGGSRSKTVLSGYIINLPKFEGGARGGNPWIKHVKKYAKEKNISYACAISEAKLTYKKIDKKEKEEQFRREQIILWNNAINRFMKRYDDDNDSLPLIQVNFNNRPKSFQEHLKKVSPEFYKILTNTD